MSVLGEGLLGFALGVSKSISDEYQNINDEKYKIQSEERANQRQLDQEARAQERVLAAEARAQKAWEQRLHYEQRFKLSIAEEEARLKTRLAADPETNPTVAGQELSSEAENQRIMSDKDPSRTRSYMQEMDRGNLVSAGLDSTSKRQEAESAPGGWLDQQDDRAVNRAVRTDEAQRDSKSAYLASPQYEADRMFTDQADLDQQRELLTMKREEELKSMKAGVGTNQFYFKPIEADKHFQSAIDVELGDMDAGIYRSLQKKISSGEIDDVLGSIRTGEMSMDKALTDPEYRSILRAQLLKKFSSEATGSLKTMAGKKEITDLTVVEEQARNLVGKTDQALAAMESFTSNQATADNIQRYEQLAQEMGDKQKAVAQLFNDEKKMFAESLLNEQDRSDADKLKELMTSAAFNGIWQIYLDTYKAHYKGKLR